MKKVLLLVMFLTISLTMLTYGQATVGGWGRGIFLPIIVADGDPTVGSVISWGPGGTRMGFTISGSSDNVGVVIDVLVDNGNVAVGDQQKIWVKPIEMLTLSVGSIFDDTLRGNAGFCANNWMRYDFGMAGDDYIFGRVGVGGPVNFEAAITPTDGAYAYIAFGGNGQLDLQNWMWGGPPVADEDVLTTMLKTGQYGAGYDIPGIGMIRAQFIGALSATEDPNGVINAAFKLTMIESLIVDLGAFIPMDSEQGALMVGAGTLVDIVVYANYIMDIIGIYFVSDIVLLEEGDPLWKAAIGVEYGLENGPTIQGDVRLNSPAIEDDPILLGIMAGAKWSYSNGIFGVGIEVTNSSYANWGSALVDKTDPEAMVITVPIRFEYWF
jgi:hypothetical protein